MKIEEVRCFLKVNFEQMGLEDEGELVGENKFECRNGTNEIVKAFCQNCVICFKNLSVYAFKQGDQQCLQGKFHKKNGLRID